MKGQAHIWETFNRGGVVCNIGQVNDATKRQLDKLVRQGFAVKWRGYWHPCPGAQHGIGPLKSCWGLASVYSDYTRDLTGARDAGLVCNG